MSESTKSAVANESTYILEGQKSQQPFYQQSPGSEGSLVMPDDTKQLIEDPENDKYKNSLPLASFNYINSIVGSGVIGIAYAFRQAGFGLGLILLIGVGIITDYSLIIMVRAAHLSGDFTYQGIMKAAFGQPGFVLLSILQFSYPFIAMVSYNVVVGDTVTKVLVRLTGLSTYSIFARRDFVTFVATILITLPLCLQRDVARLARVSFLSLLFVAAILIAIIIRAPTMAPLVPDEPDAWKFADRNVIPAIGIMAFAFMCHHNTFLIYESMRQANQPRWDSVTHISVGTSAIISLIFGIVGYATFTEWSQGDLLENYCWSDDLMNAARLLFSATILLTYPIECFVARDVLKTTILSNVAHMKYFNIIVTMAIVTSTYFLSMTTDCLGIVLELNGILAAVPLAYLLPALSYCKLEEGPMFSMKKLPAIITALFGAVVAILGTIMLVIHFDTASECSHGEIMSYCVSKRLINGTIT